MNPEQWQQLQSLFHSARQLSPPERIPFIDKNCGEDKWLRQELESLLASQELAVPLFDCFSPDSDSTSKPELLTGRTIDRYRLISLIGKGGMGEVYLAEDLSLGRKVALKLLSAPLTGDVTQLRRFDQEACAVSALDHPNIVSIFEIGEADSLHFIAMEFVKGETLRQVLERGRVELRAALEIAIQIGLALAAAHRGGVVHRDIKPENVMLRDDGYVKILDFGIAKLTGQASATTSAEALKNRVVKTEPGLIIGTIDYMSPEQVRGMSVDTRSDIWSFGVVIYEMLTASKPFAGETNSDIIASILHNEAEPLARLLPEIPIQLQEVIATALSKDLEKRYQVIDDLVNDLKRLRQQIDSVDVLTPATPVSTEVVTNVIGNYRSPAGQLRAMKLPLTSRLERKLAFLPNLTLLKMTVFVGAIIAIVVGSVALYRELGSRETVRAPFQSMRLSRLTATGTSVNAAISPNGKYVAYVALESGRQTVWLTEPAIGAIQQLVPPAGVRYRGLTFSHDSQSLYYVMVERHNPIGGLYRVSVPYANPTKLITDVDSPITLSPDGKQLAFVRNDPTQGETALIVAEADGTNERKLAVRKKPDLFTFQGPAWSPDGKVIACTARSSVGGFHFEVVGIRIEDGTTKPMSPHRWWLIGRITWASNGRGLILTGADQEQIEATFQLWYLTYPDGAAFRVTNDLNNYNGVSVTSDSRTLVTVRADYISKVWTSLVTDINKIKPATYGTASSGTGGISWTPDGRIVYESNASGNNDLWIADADGSDPKQLTTDLSAETFPSVSPDGKCVAFTSNRLGAQNVWRMDIDGQNVRQLTVGNGESLPSFSPDGKWVMYESYSAGTVSIWRVPAEGGNAELIQDFSSTPAVSPDGKWIACVYRRDPTSRFTVAVIPFDGGEPVRVLEAPKELGKITGQSGTILRTPLRWTPDGHSIAFVESHAGTQNIWTYSLANGSLHQLTNLSSDEQIFFFDWSRNGKSLALTRGLVASDVVLLTNLK
jgi:eukaryotic-like serine/threonine-protein kinase